MNETKFEETHLPCPCGESSDAYARNSDGSAKCFSCGKFVPAKSDSVSGEFTYQTISYRGITRATFEKYRTQFKIDGEGNPYSIGFRYPNGAIKERLIKEKKFYSHGEMSKENIYGSNCFSAGSSSAICITEGELDAHSVYQMSRIVSVSVRSASSAERNCKEAYEYINSFPKIYVCFDNDEPGKKATEKVAKLFSNSKLFVVNLTKYKDANDYLVNNASSEFVTALNNAKRYLPDNIISSYHEVESILGERTKDAYCDYPFPKLQEMTYGMRTSEVVLIKALEGIGKTEILRAIESHILEKTDDNIGVIHLEERKDRTIKGFAGYALGLPVHLPDTSISNGEILKGYRDATKRDNRLHIYNHFGSDNPDDVLSTIRFLVAVLGCRAIFLDHITMLVSGSEVDDERRKLDYISTQLKMMAEELDFVLVFISHVNDNGDTRGSRNISKIADVVIKLDRNKLAETEDERNTTYLTLEKNRFAGNTGPAGKLFFDRFSFMIKDFDEYQNREGLIPKTG